jgi:hypothetical protein
MLLRDLDKSLKAGGNLDNAKLCNLHEKHRLLDAHLQQWIAAQAHTA